MVKSITFILFSLFWWGNYIAQVTDDFSDGDFSNNPTWSGTTGDFIVNGTQQLQLTSLVAGASYLTTPHSLTSLDNKEWRIWVKQ